MKNVITITSALFFFTYCSISHKRYYFELPVLEEIAKLSSIEPPPAIISVSSVFVISTTDSVTGSSFPNLLHVYKALYTNQYAQFHDFLFDALNQVIKIDTHHPRTYLYFSHSFVVNSNISSQYKEKGIEGLIEQYCISNKGRYTIKDKYLTADEIDAISYYFFLNQYMRSDDDNVGTINFKSLMTALVNVSN